MKVSVQDRKLREALEQIRSATRQYGADVAKKLHLRRDALAAAESLADFWPPNTLPERCHEMVVDLAGLISMDLKHPWRLLFRPLDVVPSDDMRTRWKSIKQIEIVSVEDTHG